MNHAEQKPKKRFVLTMRNQKGQVGIFVALIFQVIFVFFAMLVNVGLVVHHKINLQQSTDLAAYYGAMKQAEIMNVMAHVNYQIRQSWKLFTWRYRILGSFGIERKALAPPDAIEMPVQWFSHSPAQPDDLKPKYNPASANFSCPASFPNAAGVTITDVPFMCLGHNGFQDWISSPNGDYAENFCKVDCRQLNNIDVSAFKISDIKGVGTASIFGNNYGKPINDAINKANSIVENTCKYMGPITTQMLAVFYGSFIKDVQSRKRFIEMLAKDLGLSETDIKDIQGESILKGVTKTLQNNLTEANLASMTDKSITTFNGGKSFGGGISNAEKMMHAISVRRLLFYLIDCKYNGTEKDIKLKSFYNAAGDDLDQNLIDNMLTIMDPATVENLRAVFKANNEDANFLGFEKNPWIHIYYGVKATSEPKIPFLPLAKIKLNAISFAKPFGGTIGPWYYKTWPSGEEKSANADWGQRTDINLPRLNPDGYPSNPTLKDAREYLPNYSTYVGDNYAHDGSNEPGNKAGLANTKIVAFYHNLLANKYGEDNDSEFSKDKIPVNAGRRGRFFKPDRWPRLGDWNQLMRPIEDPAYDPLAVDRVDGENSPKNSFMRDIELSVLAPNQFDVTYYSIEPDFDKNYVRKIKIGPLAAATGTSPAPLMPIDYGNPRLLISGIPKVFAVRHQLEVTHKMFKDKFNKIVGLNGNSDAAMRFGLDVIASKQSSLLTGWTFLNLTADGYTGFPGPNSSGKNSMLFGTCDNNLNPWSDVYHAPYDEDENLPGMPGNCLTGGRTGYSVKLISSDILREGRPFENLGGGQVNGKIINFVPEDFFNF